MSQTQLPDLHEQLQRWVGQGLLQPDEAVRIEAAETATDRLERRRTTAVVEALGYVGAVLTCIAGFEAVRRLWPDIPTAAELAFAAVGAVALLAAGAAVRPSGSAPLERLRSVLWVLSTACVTAFAAVLGAEVLGLRSVTVTAGAAGVAAGYAFLVWQWAPTPLQHLALFGALVVVAGAGTERLADHDRWAPGLAVWLLSVGWGAAVHHGYLAPLTTGYVAAAVGAVEGTVMMQDTPAGVVLGLVTVSAVLAAAVALRRGWLLAVGAVGVLQVVPFAAGEYLPHTVGTPLALLVVGLAALGAAARLARRG